jgi:nucleoside phosphorylase
MAPFPTSWRVHSTLRGSATILSVILCWPWPASRRWPATPAPRLAAAIGAKPGIVSTGNSLDFTPAELDFLRRERVSAKDMEATAIAQVCVQCGVPFVAVKAVTDLVDHPEPVQEAFLRNLRMVSALLAERLEAGVRWLGAHPRRIADL